MTDLPPSDPAAIEAPERPEGGVATRIATSVSSEGYGVDPEAPGVRYGWLRLAGLIGVLALIVFLLSCLGPVLARLGWLPHVPQTDGDTFLVMMLMNAATAIILVAFLTTMPRGRERRPSY